MYFVYLFSFSIYILKIMEVMMKEIEQINTFMETYEEMFEILDLLKEGVNAIYE